MLINNKKLGIIFVLFNTSTSEVIRLTNEIKQLKIASYELYFIDNSTNHQGYAAGVNQGLKQAINDNCDYYLVANPDISIKSFMNSNWYDVILRFDIWGYAMRQDNQVYYGGKIDQMRMSGGLISKKPKTRFNQIDFVSGSLIGFSKKVVDTIGYWNEDYFMYYEEVDYCYRAKKAGLTIGIDSKTIYDHFEISKNTNPQKNYLLAKNRIKFLLKYGSLKQKIYELLRLPKTIIEEIIKRPFYLNFFSLNFSSLINKVLHFVLFLLLIRNYSPGQYAVYTLAWTHLGLFLPLLDFGTTSYGLVNLANKKDNHFNDLFSMRVVLSLITFVVTIIMAVVFGYKTQIFQAILLTSFVVFSNMLSGTYLILISIKEKSYLASIVSMIFQLILVSCLIAAVFFHQNVLTLFWIIFILYNGYSLANYLLIKKLIQVKFTINISQWIKIGKKSIIFLLISILASFYSKIDVLLLNFIKGQEAVGIYSAGYRFLDALMFIITAYNVSAQPVLSKLFQSNKQLFISKIKKDFIFLIILGFSIALGFYLFSPLVLTLLFKQNYYSSILVLRVIIFSLPLILLTSVFINSIYAINKAKYIIYIFVIQLLFNIISNLIFIPIYGYMASSYITIIGEILNVLLTYYVLTTNLKKMKLIN